MWHKDWRIAKPSSLSDVGDASSADLLLSHVSGLRRTLTAVSQGRTIVRQTNSTIGAWVQVVHTSMSTKILMVFCCSELS
jgi:hypothetical protein